MALLLMVGVGISGLRAQSVSGVDVLSAFPSTGAVPVGTLVQDAVGNFYGTTEAGGPKNLGTVFQVTPDGILTPLVTFDGYNGAAPLAGLILAADGNFYGTTAHGGADYSLGPDGYYGAVGKGTIFRITPTGDFTTLVSFADLPDGGPVTPSAALLQAADGNFYGTSAAGGSAGLGTVFKMTPDGAVSVLVNFDGTNGAAPVAPLIQVADQSFYGTTQGTGTANGTAFRLTADGTLTTLATFAPATFDPTSTVGGPVAGGPAAPLLLAPDGNFYGTTEFGGGTSSGSVFQLTPGGELNVLYSFNANGQPDGEYPRAGLTLGNDGALYGTTRYGSAAFAGTIFRVTTDGAYNIVATPADSPGTASYAESSLYYQHGPAGGLLLAPDGNFYGTTTGGSTNGIGQVFQMTPDGELSTLAFFFFPLGANPSGPLAVDPGGSLYGVSAYGGFYGDGAAFVVAPDGSLTTLADFSPFDTTGIHPSSPLTRGADGNFYGVTLEDAAGTYHHGSLYRLTPDGVLSTVASPPALPVGAGPLTLGTDNNLYGLSTGDPTVPGSFFRVNADATVTTLHTFPQNFVQSGLIGTLTVDASGDFYGVTPNGGANGQGTIFKLTPAGDFSTVLDFNGTNGGDPRTALVIGSDGNFYGTTVSGGHDGLGGSLFQLTHGGNLTILARGNFNNSDGEYGPNLVVASDGGIYGYENSTGLFRLGADGSLNAVAGLPLSFGDGESGVVSDYQFTAGLAGKIYGTSLEGGQESAGAVYVYDPAGGASPTPTPTPPPTPPPTATPTPTPGVTPSPTPSPTATPPPGVTPTPAPSPTATPTPAPTPTGIVIYGLSKLVGGDKGPLALTISGSGLDASTKVTLTAPGLPDIVGTNVTLVDNGFGLQLTFDLTGAADGVYALNLVNGNGASATRPAAFQVVPATYAISNGTGGDTGTATFTITGNVGFQAGATVKLSAPGQPDLRACAIGQDSAAGTLTATMNLLGKPHGQYAITVVNPDGSTVPLPLTFTVEAGQGPQTYADLLGRDVIRAGYAQTYSVVVGNHGDNDALAVPVFVYVPVQWTVTPPPDLIDVPLPVGATDGYPAPPEPAAFTLTPSDDGTRQIVALIVPFIPAGGTRTVQLGFTVPDQAQYAHVNFSVGVQVGDPLFGQSATADDSTASSLPRRGPHVRGDGDVDIDIDGIPYTIPRDCVYSLIKLGFSGLGLVFPPETCLQKGVVFLANTAANYQATGTYNFSKVSEDALGLALECAITLTPGAGEAYAALDATKTLTELIINCIDKPIKDLQVQSIVSGDPNDLTGSTGDGSAAHFLSGTDPLNYLVSFANEATASAAAQTVTITDTLDPQVFDTGTFTIGAMAFGSVVVTPPSGLNSYSTVVDLRPANDLLVKITAGIDPATGIITYVFTSLDPTTGLATTDPLAGFLPPDNAPPAGEGYVLFSVKPKPGMATNTAINNQASIIFDVNQPIATPTWLNTVDNTPPTSTLKALPNKETSAKIKLKVHGTDDGSGVNGYNVYVSEDGGAFSLLAHGAGPKIIFQGVTGHGYRFFAQAYDKAGNFEALKNVKETKTEIVGADLIGAWTTENAKPKASGAVKFKGKLTVTNQSPNKATAAGGVVRVYLSATETLDASAKVIGADLSFGVLAPGASVTLAVNTGKLPGGATAAGQYVIAVINPDRTLPETDFTNNTLVYGPLP